MKAGGTASSCASATSCSRFPVSCSPSASSPSWRRHGQRHHRRCDLLHTARFQSIGRRLARRAGSEDRAEMTEARAGAGEKESIIRRWTRLALVAAFVAAVVGFFALGGEHYLALDTIKQNRDALLA